MNDLLAFIKKVFTIENISEKEKGEEGTFIPPEEFVSNVEISLSSFKKSSRDMLVLFVFFNCYHSPKSDAYDLYLSKKEEIKRMAKASFPKSQLREDPLRILISLEDLDDTDEILTLKELREHFKAHQDTEIYEDLPMIRKILKADHEGMKKLRDKERTELRADLLKTINAVMELTKGDVSNEDLAQLDVFINQMRKKYVNQYGD